jgi:hypothetical protein
MSFLTEAAEVLPRGDAAGMTAPWTGPARHRVGLRRRSTLRNGAARKHAVPCLARRDTWVDPTSGTAARRWPSSGRRRWAIRGLWTVLLSAAAFTAGVADSVGPGAPLLVAAVAGGSVLGAGPLAAAIVAGSCAALGFHAVVERLLRAGLRPSVGVLTVLLITIVLAPVWVAAARADLPGSCAVTLLIASVDGLLRFTAAGETHGGIVAGLLLATAYGCDAGSVGAIGILVALAPLLVRLLGRWEPGAGTATVAVMAFPVVATALSMAFLRWRLSGDAGAVLSVSMPPGPDVISVLVVLVTVGGFALTERSARRCRIR